MSEKQKRPRIVVRSHDTVRSIGPKDGEDREKSPQKDYNSSSPGPSNNKYEETRNDDSTKEGQIFSFPKRYILAIMIFTGFMNMYAIRVNLNVAIGAMINNHTVVKDGKSSIVAAEFDWNSRMQGIILGSFYYGYMVLQIPGGYMAMKFGATRIFGIGVLLASLFTILTPPAVRLSAWGLVALRILEGLTLGVMLPCNYQIWSQWAPVRERTTLAALSHAGMNVGTIVTMPLTGLLTKYGFDGGWASVFYCFGASGVVWFIAWVIVVHELPSTHPTISKSERTYIENNVQEKVDLPVPWRKILSSGPVWGIIIGNVANDWGLYTILICLPLFLMDIMQFNIQTMGFVASLPFLLKAVVGPLAGFAVDVLRYKYMSTANVRRLVYAVGAFSAAILIVISGYTSSPHIAVGFMCLGVAMSSLLHSGYEVNLLDIAPPFSGIIMGISNTAGTTTGFLSPLLVGIMTEGKRREEWQQVFWITMLVYIVGTIVFCSLVSGHVQSWAKPDEEESDDEGDVFK